MKQTRIVRWLSAIAVLFLAIVSTSALWAQGAGELTGVVTDPTSAVVARAQVKLTNDATGVVRTTETTAAGVFRFTALPIVGTYTLSMEMQGYRPVNITGITVSVGTTITRDVALEVGTKSETVTVEANAQMVQTTESSVSQLVDQRIWQQMPLSVRNQNEFITLVAGSVPDSGSTRGASVNGARGGTGNYMVNGMDNNDQGQGGRGQLSGYDPGGAATSISPEAIQEYRVVTNSFAAEYGKAGGFVTDTVLKTGTNKWHGSLFEYNRIQALAAQGYFSHPYWGDAKDSLVRNQFGASIGGPIIKDKLFFNFTTEFHRAREANALHATTTTQQFLDFVNSGAFESFMETTGCQYAAGAACAPGSLAHANTLGTIFKGLAEKGPFPLATSNLSTTGHGLYTEGLTYPVPVYGDVFISDPSHLNEYRYTGTVDYNVSSKDTISWMMLWQHDESGDPYQGGGNTIGPASLTNGMGFNSGVSWTHTLTPTLINVAKFSYLRHRNDFPAPPGTLGIPMILTWNDPMTVGFGLYAGSPQYFTDNQFQLQDSISFIHGKHAFKFGGEYRRTRNGSRFYNDTFGTFYPWGVEDLVTDMYFTQELEQAAFGIAPDSPDGYGSVAYTQAAVDPTTGNLPNVYRGFRANEYAWFVQDDWRISDRFTVNLGLRYEYFGPPHNFKPNIDSNFYFGSPVTPISTTSNNPYLPIDNPYYARVAGGSFQVRNNEIWNKDNNNFGPRAGFAWDALGNQRFVVRAGAGIMYDRIFNNLFENIRFNPPYYSDNQTGALSNGVGFGALSNPGVYSVPFTGTSFYNGSGTKKPVPNPRHMDQNIVSPYYEQFHFGFQWEFAKGYVFEPEYIGTLGHKLTGYRDINTFDGRLVPGYSTKRINTNIGADNYRSNEYSSNYHGLQLAVRKNYANGLTFNSAYTWSKAMDTISDAFNSRSGAFTVSDPMNIGYDYGPADFNMKYRWITTLSYDIPFMKENRWIGGWSANTIIDLHAGIPFTPYSSSGYDLNKNGIISDRLVPTAAPSSTYTGGNPAMGYFNVNDWGLFNQGTDNEYTSLYQCPATVNDGNWCNAPIGRNSMVGPKYTNFDFNLNKKFRVTEGSSFAFQASFFNLFNHPNFGLPTANLASSANFGRSTTASAGRETQLSLRFDF